MRKSRSAEGGRPLRRVLSPAAWVSFGLAAAVLLIPSVVPGSAAGWRTYLELSASDPAPPTQLVIEAPLLAKLRTLADGLHAEVALCLFGTVDGETAHLTDFFMPEPTLSTPNKSLVRPCPRETLAVWHNHPLSSSQLYWSRGPRRALDRIRQAHHLCVLSNTDIKTSIRFQHPFVIVGVDRDTWCWWTREEVERFASDGTAPGLPSPGKLVTAEADTSRPVASADKRADEQLGEPDGASVSRLGAPPGGR